MHATRYAIAFETTHGALEAEARLKSSMPGTALIPTPTEISAACGMALAFDAPDDDAALAIGEGCVAAHGASLHRLTDEGYRLIREYGSKRR